MAYEDYARPEDASLFKGKTLEEVERTKKQLERIRKNMADRETDR